MTMTAKKKMVLQDPHRLEQQARQEWSEYLRLDSPGFAYSDHPAHFRLKARNGAENCFVTINDMWRYPDRWDKIPGFLKTRLSELRLSFPRTWKYEHVVPNTAPNPLDLSNLRYYTLDGNQVPSWAPKYSISAARLEFKKLLSKLFYTASTNKKDDMVRDFLDHHSSRGGNPNALRTEVNRMLIEWKSKRPSYGFINNERPFSDPDYHQFLTAIECWLSMADHRPTSPKQKSNAPSLIDKLAEVEGAEQKFMGLVRSTGLIDANGRWIANNRTKGKGKLIAAWDAVVEVLNVPGFVTATALASALKNHFPGLENLDRLDRVRGGKLYGELLAGYVADLHGN